MQLNIPTLLTLFRVVMIPFFILAFYLPCKHGPIYCALIFILASVTDWFDGFLARRWRNTTHFGAFLDPVVDKIMVTIGLVMVTEYFHSWWITLPVSIMIAREIVVSALRQWIAERGKYGNSLVCWIAKIKTTLQMFALVVLLWRPAPFVVAIGTTALYLAVVLTLWSMHRYFHLFRQYNVFKGHQFKN